MLSKEAFLDYCNSFSNSKDKEDVYDKYYAPDAIFQHPIKGVFKGKKEITSFWEQGHKGIHEFIMPKTVLMGGNMIAADFVIEWECTENTEYLGKKEAGDISFADCCAFYEFDENDKFKNVKIFLNVIDKKRIK